MIRASLIFVILPLTACSSNNQWTEDVLFANGEIVTIERQTRILRVLLSDGNGSIQEQWIEYQPLMVKWHTDNILELPLSFDVIDGTPYLVTTLRGLCALPGGQISGLRIVAWRDKRQFEVPFEQAPLEKMTYNLHRDFKGIRSSDDTHTHQSLDAKRVGWRGFGRFGADPDQGRPLEQWDILLKRKLRPCKHNA